MKRLSQSRVFYYPACGFEWSPILNYRRRCGVFVYCDWTIKKKAFVEETKSVIVPGYSVVINDDSSRLPMPLVYSEMMDKPPWYSANLVEPWFAKVLLHKDESNQEGMNYIWLLYFAGNPVCVYRCLLANAKVYAVLLRKPWGVSVDAWQALVNPMSDAMREHKPQRQIC